MQYWLLQGSTVGLPTVSLPCPGQRWSFFHFVFAKSLLTCKYKEHCTQKKGATLTLTEQEELALSKEKKNPVIYLQLHYLVEWGEHMLHMRAREYGGKGFLKNLPVPGRIVPEYVFSISLSPSLLLSSLEKV